MKMELSELLEAVDNMSIENQEIFIDIVNKRIAERKRQILIQETLESRNEYLNGNVETGNSEDLFKSIGI